MRRIRRWFEDKLGVTARRAEANRQKALKGRATSGHLSPGERQRLFRNRRKAS